MLLELEVILGQKNTNKTFLLIKVTSDLNPHFLSFSLDRSLGHHLLAKMMQFRAIWRQSNQIKLLPDS